MAATRQYDDLLRLVRSSVISREEVRERLRRRGLMN
jgi:hypothetical protein